ncbi:maleylacetoacetate isomerase [Porphyrobacter algicida]|uniref:Maleylacetoacetate isomerase n=1 Tax=Qipengyuania algicida TaxID=1836209 RepID=A0A845AGX0_9SPHN|nr:maleylacetoacetate isomerase [Qipengyuania algicida]MXP28679.1 maleylacetoacetate isomerase [Qipengyuania algicida]
MKLYGYFRSSTSYRLRIALELKGLPFDYVPVNLVKSEQKDATYTARNPFGSVPLLEADGRDRAQSMAQLEWLEEAHPQPPLLPGDLEQRFTARELAYAIATETHAVNNLPVLKYLKDPLGASQDQVDEWYRHWLARTFTPMEERLAQLGTGEFLFDTPSLFEVVLIPQLYNAHRFGLDFTPYPHISRIEAACLALPAFQRAHPDNQIDSPEYSGQEQTI